MKGWRFLHRGSDAFWAGAMPTGWPRPAWWMDLSSGWIVDSGRGGRLDDRQSPDEVLYVPPVPEEFEAERCRSAARWSQAGRPLLLQVVAGSGLGARHLDAISESGRNLLDANTRAQVVTLWDPTAMLLRGAADELPKPPPECWVLWPVVPAVSDDLELIRGFVEDSAAQGVPGILPLVPNLSPRARREIVDHHGSEAFEALHHGADPNLAEVAAAIVDAGLDFQPPRPARETESALHSRACTVLGWLGDLYLRLGEQERGQRILKAQRWLETAQWDFEVIARDGHLDLVPELAGEAGEVLTDLIEPRDSSQLQRVRYEYLRGASDKGDEVTG